uniref:Uncharacterized protein n=1 Tax=Ditylenchus dipsaci TaxID=166011 RepID=A0A915DF14_9BILA
MVAILASYTFKVIGCLAAILLLIVLLIMSMTEPLYESVSLESEIRCSEFVKRSAEPALVSLTRALLDHQLFRCRMGTMAEISRRISNQVPTSLCHPNIPG